MVAPNAVSSSFPVLGDRGPLNTTWGFHLAFLGYAGINVATMGHLVDANMSFIVYIATRKSVLLWVLGLRFEHVVQFHRWVGRVTVLLALAHSAWCVTSRQTDVDPNTSYTDMWTVEANKYGAIAMGALLLMLLTSLNFFRRAFYSIFLLLHILAYVTAFALLYFQKHWIVYYGYVTLAFFAFDHLVWPFIIATTCPQHAVDAAVF